MFSSDINECLSVADADCPEETSYCVNIPGSFECTCKEGYRGDGKNCTSRLFVFL